MEPNKILRAIPSVCSRDPLAATEQERTSRGFKDVPYPLPEDFQGNTVFYYDVSSLSMADGQCCLTSKSGEPDTWAPMYFRSHRPRLVKNSESEGSCLVMVPRMVCSCCKKMRTMYPYFLYGRKKFSLVAIQEIVFSDTSPTAGYDPNARNMRRWVIDRMDEIFLKLPPPSWYARDRDQLSEIVDLCRSRDRKQWRRRGEAEREIIRNLQHEYGDDWLLDLFREYYEVPDIDLTPLRTL